MIKEVPCMECEGRGFITKFGEYFVWSERCPNCGGTGIVKVPMTNSDRVRAMSDEELSEWLCQALDCDFCKAYLQNMSIYSCCENQVKGIFDWLQSPAEEDTK